MGSSYSTLEDMIMYGDIADVKDFLKEKQKDVKNKEEGASHLIPILHRTCKLGNRPIQKLQTTLQLLLDHGVNVDGADHDGWTGLHHACSVGNVVLAHFLLARKATVSRTIHGLLPHDLLPLDTDIPTIQKPWFASLVMTLKSKSDDDDIKVSVRQEACEWGSPLLVHFNAKTDQTGYLQLLYTHDNVTCVYGAHITVSGTVDTASFETSNLPERAVLNIVFVQCDVHLLHRAVLASTMGIPLGIGVAQYRMTVAGVVFHHTREALHEKEFESTEAFKEYMTVTRTETGDVEEVAVEDSSPLEEVLQIKKPISKPVLPFITATPSSNNNE